MKPPYRTACEKWRSDTVAGAGQPENFIAWDPTKDYLFGNFTDDQSPALLTWIFMKDRHLGYILEEEKDDLPASIQITEGDNDNNNSSMSSIRTNSGSKKGSRGISQFADGLMNVINEMNDKFLKGLANLSSGVTDSPAQTVPASNSSTKKRKGDVSYYSSIAKTAETSTNMMLKLEAKMETLQKDIESNTTTATSEKRKKKLCKSLEMAYNIQNQVLAGVQKDMNIHEKEEEKEDDDDSSGFSDSDSDVNN